MYKQTCLACKRLQMELQHRVSDLKDTNATPNDSSDPLAISWKGVVGDHDHHDHSHVDMVGSNVRVEGALDRQALEQLLPSLVSNHQVVRLKGRVWLPSKTLPLQIQMVGPRLNSWFEAAPSHAWRPDQGCGADLVVLALNEAAAPALESGLQRLVQATPAKASPAAATPES